MAIRIMVVYGTRPEAIKLAPVILRLEEHTEFDPFIVVTGQHREMLDQVNSLFGIEPDADLDLMVHGASLSQMSASAMSAISQVMESARPDAVIVQGDTSTAFIAALVGFYHHVPIVHVEAGLRTGDLTRPFPEEANRVIVSHIAQLHLAPTESAKQNLLQEKIESRAVVVTGNTVIDALQASLQTPVTYDEPAVGGLIGSDRKYVLVTAHRRESWGKPMSDAMAAIRESALARPDLNWLLPMHRNPTVRSIILEHLAGVPNILTTEPLGYHEFCHAMASAHLIITDSGGVQEEAPSLGKPVLLMRESTERPEAVDTGTVKLVGTEQSDLTDAISLVLDDADTYSRMSQVINPYGDGLASGRVVAALECFFSIGDRLPDFTPPQVRN